jgi:hypothetical protein
VPSLSDRSDDSGGVLGGAEPDIQNQSCQIEDCWTPET